MCTSGEREEEEKIITHGGGGGGALMLGRFGRRRRGTRPVAAAVSGRNAALDGWDGEFL